MGVLIMAKKQGNVSSITTIPESLTVQENAGLTSLGILAPSDSVYPTAKLTITVTALPTDGTIYLSDGVTAVHVGQKLTVAQLTTLLFKAKPGLFGTSSTFIYTVTDPSGTTAKGTATLSIAPNSLPPITSLSALTVAENAGP